MPVYLQAVLFAKRHPREAVMFTQVVSMQLAPDRVRLLSDGQSESQIGRLIEETRTVDTLD